MFKYIQAAPNTDGNSVRFQVVTDAFPLGYMSGNCEVESVPEEEDCYVPSMRGSGRLYTPCYIDDDMVFANGSLLCDVASMVDALNAPSPAYSASDVEGVRTRVLDAIECARRGKVESNENEVGSQDLASKIASAIVAVLREAGIGK